MDNLEFALEMKNKRLASGLSQRELASLTHVSIALRMEKPTPVLFCVV